MRGTVEEINTAKPGKPRVKVGGQWYSIKGAFGLSPGQQIDFDSSSWDYQGKTYHGIDKWGLVPGTGTVAAVMAQQTNGAAHHLPATSAPHDVALTGDELRFISNVVGSAITSGKIVDPVDLIAWVKGAQGALQAL